MLRSLLSGRIRPFAGLLLVLLAVGAALPATAAQRAVLGEIFSSSG